MPELPSGTITFLFTDIEGSTKLWERCPDAMRLALAYHDKVLRETIERHNGCVFKTVGDAFCAAFPNAVAAIHAAVEAQLALMEQKWEETGVIRVRMGLHTGEAEERDNDYFGQTLNRVARLQSVGHGHQTLISQATYALVCKNLPLDVTLQDMGQHRLKDLMAPEHVWQLLHPALPTEFSPLKSLDYLPTNLPRQLSSFIGREREIQEVKQLLPSTSLLTLIGTGGTGKTRLALQVGADVLDHYKDGVWLVELAAISDSKLVSQVVATSLEVREEAGRNLVQSIQAHLRDKQALLILDNCEHLLDDCAFLINILLKACPHLTILTTSRELLGVSGESLWHVPPLMTPDVGELPLETRDPAMFLMEYDAPRLFVERAIGQRQDFVLTRSNVPAVAHLCQHLDGIPLAIELAAARVRLLSVEEINSKLDDRFHLLTGGSRTVLPRQQTLRALIDWSYDLLNIQEKNMLQRLSVFVGGWSLEAAQQVCSGEGIEEWEVLEMLSSLVDKSLIAHGERDGHTRYRLLETVRRYAKDRLIEAGNENVFCKSHYKYFSKMTEEAKHKLNGLEQSYWLNKMETEYGNVRVALDWSMNKAENGEASLRFTSLLYRFWDIRSYFTEGREYLSLALSHSDANKFVQERATALFGMGWLAWRQGDYVAAKTAQKESLDLCQMVGDKYGTAPVCHNVVIENPVRKRV